MAVCGNHDRAEKLPDGKGLLCGGINDFDFEWHLAPGELLEAPEAVIAYSDRGLGEMSRAFHDVYRSYLINPRYVNATRPIVINNWEGTAFDFDTQKLIDMAEAVKGLGIDTFVLDDGWFGNRNSDKSGLGDWFVNEEKLPGGLKGIIDYVHSKGLKFGMYSCAGSLTCAGYPASFEYEFIDAETFASWGVDYLKYDYCFKPITAESALLYRKMGLALQSTGRDILYSACSWGVNESHKWIKSTGANMWRTTGDINDSWESIKNLYVQNKAIIPYNAPNCFGDMDMLVVGMDGKSFIDGFWQTNGCSELDHKTHFSIWCMYGSPLMIGCDIRKMSDNAKAILTNKEAIAINQDGAYNQVYRLTLDRGPEDALVCVRLLENGDFAVGVFNLMDGEYRFVFGFDEMGITTHCGKEIEMTEVGTGEKEKLVNGTVNTVVEGHGCKLYRLRLIEK